MPICSPCTPIHLTAISGGRKANTWSAAFLINPNGLTHEFNSIIQMTFFSWLEYTRTTEIKCTIHHALQDQAQSCGYYTRSISSIRQDTDTLNNSVNYLCQRMLTRTAFPGYHHPLESPLPEIVEQSTLEHFQWAFGWSVANN